MGNYNGLQPQTRDSQPRVSRLRFLENTPPAPALRHVES